MAFTKKRSGSETRKRAPIIAFRATDEERTKIEAAAERAGLTVGSYLRSRALDKPATRAVRRPPAPTAQLAQLLGLLGGVGGDLHRIARGLNAGEQGLGAELQAALADFRAAASEIMRALGKRPHDH
jgi:hypothetical protein